MTGIERRVSVIVATPVGRPWDGRALASVLRNRDPRFEVWIADGRDREEARGKRDPVDPFPGALGKDPRVHLLRIPARSSATIHNETIARATKSARRK